MKEQIDLLLGNCWVLHKVLKWYLPTHSVEFSSQGPFRYELRPAIPVQPLEQQWRNNLIYYSETVEFYTRFWSDISQLILWNSLHKGHIDMNLDPPFLYNHWNNNEGTVWFITRKLLSSTQGSEMISPNSFCGFLFRRAIDMSLDPPFLHNLWTNQTWFISREVLGGRKLLLKLKHVKPYLFLKKLFLNIAKNWFPWQSHQNLKCYSKNEITVRDVNDKQSPTNQFLTLRWTPQMGSWFLNCLLKGIGIN